MCYETKSHYKRQTRLKYLLLWDEILSGTKENNLHGHESRKNSQQQTSEYLSEKHVKPIYMKVITEENLGKTKKIRKISNLLQMNLVELY